MRLIKQLSFVPLFLISLAILLYKINPLLGSYGQLLSFNLNTAWQFGELAILLLVTSLCFVIFGTLAQSWRAVFVVALMAAALPFLIMPGSTGMILSVIIFLVLIFSFSLLDQKLKTYFSFQPGTLLTPPTKNLATLMLVGLSFIFYLSINAQIQEKGFEVPDELIDSAIKLSAPTTDTNQFVKGEKYVAQLTPAQIELLKQHPEELKKYNIDPKMLDSITPTTGSTSSKGSSVTSVPLTSVVPKQLIKDQISSMIKPYQSFAAPVLALIFFTTISGFIWLISFFLSPILWLIFWIFEKSGFVNLTKEMREVKKMVV